MKLFFLGLGILLGGVILLLWSYALHKEYDRYEEQEQENSIWTRFTLISNKIDFIKYAIGAIGLILIGILMILSSLGFM